MTLFFFCYCSADFSCSCLFVLFLLFCCLDLLEDGVLGLVFALLISPTVVFFVTPLLPVPIRDEKEEGNTLIIYWKNLKCQFLKLT